MSVIENHMIDASGPARSEGAVDGALQARRLRTFLRAYFAVTFGFSAGIFGAALAVHSTRLALLSGILACLATSAVVGLVLCRRGALERAARILAYVLLIAAPTAAYITPLVSHAASVAAVVAVAAALPYCRGRPLLYVLATAFVADVAIAVAVVISPRIDGLSAALTATLEISSLAAASFLALFLLWQFSTRLRLTLDDAIEANGALERARASEASARERAEMAVAARDEFLSMASHELRTPLTSVTFQLDLAARAGERAPSPDLAEFTMRLQRARGANDRLVRLVNQLLDVSRISSGHLELDREEVDLVALASEVIERFNDQPGANELTLRATGSVSSQWDRMRLDQVLTNLITNAIKYGAEKPIEVWVEQREDAAILEVRDRGIGIPEERLASVFERFERAVSAREYGGFGLGLWIVRQIVEAHRGSVSAAVREGGGTTFVVRLPIAR